MNDARIGKSFNRLTIIERYGSDKFRMPLYKCKCICGNIKIVRICNLLKGHTKSCGCYQKEKVSEAAIKYNHNKLIKKKEDFKERKDGNFTIKSDDILTPNIIYKITNLVNNKVYIGQSSTNLKKIIGRYHKEKPTRPIIRALNKYGIANFSIEVLEYTTKDKLDEKEKLYISNFNSIEKGYNLSTGGDVNRGFKWSKESKDNLSKKTIGRYKGKNNPFYGKKHTQETINKIIASNKRRKKT